RFSFALAKLGYSVVGIEPAAAPRKIAQAEAKKRKARSVRFYPYALEDMRFANKSFDVVLCIELFHHLPDETVQFALNRFHDLLKPGGLLVFDAKNSDNPLLAWQYRRDRRPDRPLIARPLAWFVRQAEEAGFKVLDKKGVLLPAVLSPWSVIVAEKI
ncbi:MAG: class I SAM-dependent methyltransferase, partial [Candidatus Micrarchaeota archaeon]|nr:class I SAM-dependent methyltransferase [Candidatus Micrarchaeota archaeon]